MTTVTILPGKSPECAISSGVEHHLDMVGVTGSNPVSRTIFFLKTALLTRCGFFVSGILGEIRQNLLEHCSIELYNGVIMTTPQTTQFPEVLDRIQRLFAKAREQQVKRFTRMRKPVHEQLELPLF